MTLSEDLAAHRELRNGHYKGEIGDACRLIFLFFLLVFDCRS
jgi:hypothetical protein